MKPKTMAHTARTILLATATLLALATPSHASAETTAASVWSNLWRTPDQRGQALLQKGDAAGAAQAFADPEHKAHAALQAGDYTGAAQTLANIDTAEAQYNRGNALAHAGDLPGAIKAYDTALKHNPQHSDARHNRDVVAAALQKKQKPEDDKTDSSKQDKQGKDDKKQDGKPDEKPSGKNGDTPEPQQGDKSGKKPNDKPGETAGQRPGDKPGKPDNQPAAKPGEQPASAPQPGKASATVPTAPASAAKDDAAQARRDAESTLGKGIAGANDAVAPKPPTEKQIAQEQWLRAIPDDPGGLLRRKFLIQHMLRQQGQKP